MWLPPWFPRVGDNTILVFFAYGLAFFTLGIAIHIEGRRGAAGRFPLGKALWPLAAFAFMHSVAEWLQMFHLAHHYGLDILWGEWLLPSRLLLLAISGLALGHFGATLIAAVCPRHRAVLGVPAGLFSIWIIGWALALAQGWALTDEGMARADGWARYLLYFPGSLLSAWGLLAQRNLLPATGADQVKRDCTIAAGIFVLHAVFAGVVVPRAPGFPASVLNFEGFAFALGFPVQIVRGAIILAIASYVIRILRVFEVQRQLELESLNSRLQTLSARIIAAQEEERKRVARDLHDDVAQAMTALLVRLRGIERTQPPGSDRAALVELRELTTRSLENVRQLAFQLRPADLDDLGLVPAIEYYVEGYSRRYGIEVHLHVEGLRARLPPVAELMVYRIVQEALTNAARHADGATLVRVSLEQQDHALSASVSDDRKGFDVASTLRDKRRGLGLFGMQERALLVGGALRVESRVGHGTTVKVELPLPDRPPARALAPGPALARGEGDG